MAPVMRPATTALTRAPRPPSARQGRSTARPHVAITLDGATDHQWTRGHDVADELQPAQSTRDAGHTVQQSAGGGFGGLMDARVARCRPVVICHRLLQSYMNHRFDPCTMRPARSAARRAAVTRQSDWKGRQRRQHHRGLPAVPQAASVQPPDVRQAQTRISSCQEAHDWQAATAADTRDAYEQYLAQHPDGPDGRRRRGSVSRIRRQRGSAGGRGRQRHRAAAKPARRRPALRRARRRLHRRARRRGERWPAAARPAAARTMCSSAPSAVGLAPRAQWKRLSARFSQGAQRADAAGMSRASRTRLLHGAAAGGSQLQRAGRSAVREAASHAQSCVQVRSGRAPKPGCRRSRGAAEVCRQRASTLSSSDRNCHTGHGAVVTLRHVTSIDLMDANSWYEDCYHSDRKVFP